MGNPNLNENLWPQPIPEKIGQLTVPYYRTQTAIEAHGINGLVTAGEPIFSLLNKLRFTTEYADIAQLHEHLAHEIRVFEIHAKNAGYRSEMIQAARYALCALSDEIIMQTSWGRASSWHNYKMLMLFHLEPSADERFFHILERLQEDALVYLDILELFYLCLSMGFMGSYRHTDGGLHSIASIRDNLYHLLRLHRGEFSKLLSTPLANLPAATKHAQRLFNPVHSIGLFAFIGLLIYSSIQGLLYLTTQPLLNDLTQLASQHITG